MRRGILAGGEDHAASTGLKGIDQFKSQIGKTGYISGRNTGVVSQSNRCYESVHLLDSPSLPFTDGRHMGVVRSGRLIKRKNSSFVEFILNPVDCSAQDIFSPAAR